MYLNPGIAVSGWRDEEHDAGCKKEKCGSDKKRGKHTWNWVRWAGTTVLHGAGIIPDESVADTRQLQAHRRDE
ncbi:MAG: hypothetical protein NVSMB52_02580 [Chloroflexota bacterium]